MTDSLDTYRQQLVAAVEAARLTYTEDCDLVVEYDNRNAVNMKTQEQPFLCVEIEYIRAVQADLSNKPIHKIAGLLILTAKVREGAGTSKAYQLLEHFYTALQFRVIGSCRVEMSDIVKPNRLGGWWGVSAVLPFRVNKVTA